MRFPTVTGQRIRQIVVEQSYRANFGRIGSALCVADILAALYGEILTIEHPDDPVRDRFILSKGHAALALYAALHLRGWLTADELNTYCSDASWLGVHPDHCVAGIDFSTGSLGQGLSFAVGAALAARLASSPRRVFALVSDAECNEGSLWEAAMFAAHHRLTNLIAIVDANEQQAFGSTRDVLDLSPLAERWRSFGWEVRDIDGHDADAMIAAATSSAERPVVIVAHTVFGRGVSFMERQIRWHYWPMSAAEYELAMREVSAAI